MYKTKIQFNKQVVTRMSMVHLVDTVNEMQKRGWELVGEIKQNMYGQYQCLMKKENKKNAEFRI